MKQTSDVYKKLYHYTTWEGVLGILQSQTLWATHYKFLNDYSEIVLFRDKLVSFLYPILSNEREKLIKQFPSIEQTIRRQGGLDYFIQRLVLEEVKTLYDTTGDEIYISSFCGENTNEYINSNGLLSQWRGYGSGGGFALVFDTRKLEDVLITEYENFEYEIIHISDIVYSDDDTRLNDEFSEHMSHIADAARACYSGLIYEEILERTKKAYVAFISCITRYKHRGFNEENEVRIVALPIVNQDYLDLSTNTGQISKAEKERKYRDKNGQIVPYLELISLSNVKLPIERIIVGPHKDKESRVATLRTMLSKGDIEITCSDIPFAC
jgi:hypothetical protein